MQIDLNADIGEGFDDAAIIPWISSANISCGAHAGTETQIRAAIRHCKNAGVAIGAHPSYPDKTNFGRRLMDLSAQQLSDSLSAQLQYFFALCLQEHAVVRHVKPHGALYNHAAKDEATARVLLALMQQLCPDLLLVTLPDSMLAKLAPDYDIHVVSEAFADRGYRVDGSLVPRTEAGALLTPDAAVAQSLCICQQLPLQLSEGPLLLKAQSLCLHGDSKDAVALAKRLNQALVAAGIRICAAAGAADSGPLASGAQAGGAQHAD
ncbi:5-oxoprolinase subunit PxpA [Rheinheimera sp. 4Y26]|uniref:5-oxoprolinase subunit PxpA n=1 Tax=Rheinheimera sp. 4Y26 TaxID=2977811 RepID=UPI0021B1552A|nr:5-oxoprolinase subunit PxpA [Rheinheimera sp. 4Y26]MCT6699163.1 5-oxoprolinase subunit PxpA [Rheinheimera sp. 4Y26]